MDSPEYSAIKAQIEAELKKLAGAGKVTYYKDLGETIGKPARWAMWKRLLDDISRNKPDITIIVLNATSGWPGQINYNPTDGKPMHKSDLHKTNWQKSLMPTALVSPSRNYQSSGRNELTFG